MWQIAAAFIFHPDVWLTVDTHELGVLVSAPKDFCFIQIWHFNPLYLRTVCLISKIVTKAIILDL